MDRLQRAAAAAAGTDRPQTYPGADRFGYAPLARRLAQCAAALAEPEGEVLAIYGAAGTGRTTALNFVRRYAAGPGAPLVIGFNPWWFSGGEAVVRALLDQLAAGVRGKRGFPPSLPGKLAELAEAVAGTPPAAGGAAGAAPSPRPEPRDVHKLKAEVSALLGGQPRRVLVIVDDVDRLAPEEIRQMFRAVKAVGDLRNVLYLMAFDPRIVEPPLGRRGGIARDDLAKMIQASVELPPPGRAALRALFLDRLAPVLARLPEFDGGIQDGLLPEPVEHWLRTPRDAVRLANALALTLPAVAGEVHAGDFIAMEALRLFHRDLHRLIRDAPAMFTGAAAGDPHRPHGDAAARFHAAWLDPLAKSDPELAAQLAALLRRLFPRLAAVWGGDPPPPQQEAAWRRERRVCDAQSFPVYVNLALPAGAVSNAELRAMLADAGRPGAFAAALLELAAEPRPGGRTRAGALLDRLQEETGAFPDAAIEPVVSALLDVGDRILSPEELDVAPGELGADVKAGRIIFHLLKRAGAPRSFELLQAAFTQGRALYLMARCYVALAEQQGVLGDRPRPVDEWFVSPGQLLELDHLLRERIRAAANDDTLLQAPRLFPLLSLWREKGHLEEPRAWLRAVAADPARLAALLEACLVSVAAAGTGGAPVQRHDRLDPQWFEPYIPVDELAVRVGELAEIHTLSERGRRAAAQFLREHARAAGATL